MLKKILATMALVASASFATWDYFPVLEAGKGTAEAGIYYDWHHRWSQEGLRIGARYSLIQNLELSLQGWGFQLWSEDEDDFMDYGTGLRDLTIGVRYQVIPMFTAFLDLNAPIGSDEVTSDEVAIYLGGQFSMAFPEVPGLAMGSEGGFYWGFEHDNYTRGLEIHLGAEVDYLIPDTKLTPYIGIQLKMRLTKSSWEDEDGDEHDIKDRGDKQFNLWLGASYALTPELYVKGHLILRSGDSDNMGGDANGIYVGCGYNF